MHNNYSFNSQWGESVSQFESGEFCNFFLKENNEEFYFQYIKRDISNELISLDKSKYFDIVTPFDYGAFYYTSDKILQKALHKFELKCKEENIISAFIRFNPLLNQEYDIFKKFLTINKVQNHIIIDLDTQYTKKFSKRKIRNIQNAKKLNYEFIKNDSIENFYSVYMESMQRVNSSDYYKFDKNILNDLLKFGKIFSINYRNQTVSSVFIIEDENEIYYFLGGTLSNNLKDNFNSLLFNLVCEYYLNTKKIFHLGGGKDGLYQYKKEFSNKTVPFYIGKKIFNKDIYDKLVVQTNREENNFFPQYRKKII